MPMGLVVRAQDPNLLGFWKFDEGSGTTAYDSSGNNNHGTIYGPSWVPGKNGSALSWPRLSIGRVQFPNLNLISASAVTYSVWINAGSNPYREYMDVIYHGDRGQVEMQMRWDYNWSWYEVLFGVTLQNTVPNTWYRATTGGLSHDKWHHLAGVWTKGQSVKLYVDGTLNATLSSIPDQYLGGNPTGTFPGLIGAYYSGSAFEKGYEGLIDQVRIYNRALSDEEIRLLRYEFEPIEITPPVVHPRYNNLTDVMTNYTDHRNGGPINYFTDIPLVLTPNSEMHTRKAVDSNGDIHITWMSNRDGQWEIYYKEISASGTIKVSDTRISDTPYDSMFPSIALDSANDAHVVWVDHRDNSGTTWEIYYSKIQDNTGTDLTSPDWRVSSADGKDSGRAVQPTNPIDDPVTPLYIEHPDIDVDSQNNVHTVWTDYRDGNWEVYYQKQTNGATPTVLIDDLSISAKDTYNSQNPAISAGPDKSGDGIPDIHIVWQDNRDGHWEIYYEKLSGTNVPVPEKRLTSDAYNSATPDIDVDTEGYPHIVFMDQRPTDPEHSENTHLYSPPYWEIYTIALNPTTGDVLYDRDGNKRYELRQSDMRNPGTWWGVYTGATLGDGPSMYPRIAVTGRYWSYGETRITWHDYRNGNWEIYYSSVQNWCNNPSEDIKIAADPNPDMYPDIALDAQGKPDVVWQKYDGTKWSIYNARYRNDQWVRLIIDRGTPAEQTYDMTRLDPSDSNSYDGITYVFGGSIAPGGHTYAVEARNYDYTTTTTPPSNVGGIVVPIDKLGLLAPYIGLASTILVTTVATAVCVKRVKHRKEKQ
jgi:hypothetical protein